MRDIYFLCWTKTNAQIARAFFFFLDSSNFHFFLMRGVPFKTLFGTSENFNAYQESENV